MALNQENKCINILKTKFKMRNAPLKGLMKSPITKKVPNCVPKGKLKKEKGDPCWKNYVQRGMKNK